MNLEYTFEGIRFTRMPSPSGGHLQFWFTADDGEAFDVRQTIYFTVPDGKVNRLSSLEVDHAVEDALRGLANAISSGKHTVLRPQSCVPESPRGTL